MEAAHEVRLEGEAACGEGPAARAEHPRLSPAQKMEKMRLWFERNQGIPPFRDTSPGFDMGMFWHNCCSGQNKELFAAALSKSPNMRAARDARLEGKRPRAARKRRRTSQTSGDQSDDPCR